MDTIVTSLTAPGARVALLTTDTTTDTLTRAVNGTAPSTATPAVDDATTGPARTLAAPADARHRELDAAQAAVQRTCRTAVLVPAESLRIGPHRGTAPGATVTTPGTATTADTATGPTPVPRGAGTVAPPTVRFAPGANSADGPTTAETGSTAAEASRPPDHTGVQDRRPVDLVIASVDPHTPLGDHFGVVCATLLRLGGTLAVITHSDWSAGRLIDPTGAVVAACQNADLLYLQHIVALHTPIRHGRLTPPAGRPQRHPRARSAAAGEPAPHERAHRDVLLFVQPHDHHGDPHTDAGSDGDADQSAAFRSLAAAAFDGGVIR